MNCEPHRDIHEGVPFSLVASSAWCLFLKLSSLDSIKVEGVRVQGVGFTGLLLRNLI